MGIRLHNNTWHRPLRTLDNWPPMTDVSSPRSFQHARRCTHWLALVWQRLQSRLTAHRHEQPEPGKPADCPSEAAPAQHPGRRLRVTRRDEVSGRGPRGARLVISGRMADVCAELDRLAALEAHGMPQGG